MPASFPGVTLPMPLVRRLRLPCEVVEFLDGSEQRWRSGDPLNDFEVRFSDVPAADLTSVLNFWATVKGAFDATWTFTDVDGTAYPHMGFDQDELAAVENAKPGRFSFSLKLRQTAKDGAYAGVYAAAYPTLPNGCYTQRPYTASAKWLTTRNDLASGARYAWSEYGAPKGLWVCDYSVLTLAEMQGRIDFAVGCGGRHRGFSFTDPNDGSVHPKCRLDQDAVEARNVGAGQWATTLKLAEYF
jgi:hypothetical protein